MDALSAGADIATIATGLSAVTAAYVWVRNQLHVWRQQKAATELGRLECFLLRRERSSGTLAALGVPE
jgi:hypothetical protein